MKSSENIFDLINEIMDTILNTKNKMTPLQLSNEKAKWLYKTASPELKTLLEDSFPKGFFQPELFDDVQEAYRRLGLIRDLSLPFNQSTRDKRQIVANARFDLDIVAEALKLSEEKINWGDGRSKYFPVFRMHPGFGFAHSRTFYDYTLTVCGSRHSFYSEKTSDHFGKAFLHLHEIVNTEK